MASYKDPANLTFNPYVEQRPVEAMAKVGMYKQQRFDEGIQKIQESIDNVAGLDVVRPQDKEYLQSKLNALGGQLSSVAGGDFSNFSLVNSVNGMTNQIAKDPNVLNAVSSAARYRKDLETIQKLKEKGEWAESNQLEYSKEVDAWYNNEDLNSSYSANVSPYIDVQKDAQDIIKGLAKDEYNVEVMQDPTTGRYYDIMTNQEVKELTPEKIQTALKAGLSPQAWRQLSLDGKLKYSNVSDQQFVSQINGGYEKRFTLLSEKRAELISAERDAQKPSDKLSLQKQIAQLDQMINGNRQEYESISSGFGQGEVDPAKAQFYTMDWMDNISQAFSSRSVNNETKESPYFSAQIKKDQRALAQAKFSAQQKQYAQVNKDKAAELALLEAGQTNTFTIPGLPQDPKAMVIQANEDARILESEYVTDRAKLAKQLQWDDSVKFVDIDNNGIYDPAIDELNQDTGLTMFDRMLVASERSNYTNIAPSQQGDIRNYLNKKKAADTANYRVTSVANQVDAQIPIDIDAIIPEEYKGRTWEGFSAAETSILLDKFDKYSSIEETYTGTNSVGIPMGYRTTVFDDEQAQAELSAQEFALYKNVYRDTRGSENAMAAADMTNQIKDEVTDLNDRRDELTQTLMSKSVTTLDGAGVGIDVSDKLNKNRVQSILGTVAAIITEREGYQGLAPGDAETILKIEKGLTSATILTDERQLRVSGGTADKPNNITIPLSDEQYEQVTGMFNVETEQTPEVAAFNKNILPRMLATGAKVGDGERDFWTTADPIFKMGANGEIKSELTRNTNFENAFFNQFDFPNVNLYEISANLISKQDPKGDFDESYYQLNFRYNSKQGDKLAAGTTITEVVEELEGVEYGQALNKAEAAEFLRILDDAMIFEIINGRNITKQDILDLQPKVEIPK
tara:strand:+ start:1192 stop:3918 length:2727 start_codon:yes stop_codon:yes gene_type:complete